MTILPTMTVSDECVFTCPSGTFGNVSRTANVTTRNCTSRKYQVICVQYLHKHTQLRY